MSSSSNRLRVLILTYQTHVPPARPKKKDLERADWKLEYDVLTALRQIASDTLCWGVTERWEETQKTLDRWNPDIVFNLLDEVQGKGVLDHNVPSYLELMGFAYTGCNPRGLLLSRDKALAKKILSYHSIPVPPAQVIPRGKSAVRTDLDFPLIVKSLTEEASLGISQASIVHNKSKLHDRVRFIHEMVGTDALVESYVEGRELYVGVVGNHRLETLPIWELYFPRSSMGYPIATRQVKWNPTYRRRHGIRTGEASQLSLAMQHKIRDTAKLVYQVLGLSGYARIDLRLDSDGNLYVLEANPNPHIGPDEEVAESARKMGWTYFQLLEKILALGRSWEPGNLKVAA